MAVLLVLIGSILAFRGLGSLGVGAWASWPASARWGLALMLLFTASAHLTKMREDLVRMTPPWVPKPRLMVAFTGVCEILGAVGLLIPPLQRAAGLALALLFAALLPANVYAARSRVRLRGRPATPLWLRVPMQILFIALAWWSTQ